MGGGGRSQLHHNIVTDFPSSPSQQSGAGLCPSACVSSGDLLNLSGAALCSYKTRDLDQVL